MTVTIFILFVVVIVAGITTQFVAKSMNLHRRKKVIAAEPRFQQVDVGRTTVRVIMFDDTTHDLVIQGRAIYVDDKVGIIVEDSKKTFSRWRETAQTGLLRIEGDRWIGSHLVKEVYCVNEIEHFVDVRIG